MHGNDAELSALKRVRALYNYTVAAHKVTSLKIAHVAGKKSVTRAVNYEFFPVQAKGTALAYNVLVAVAMLGHVLNDLTVQGPSPFKTKGVAIGIFVFTKKP